MTSSNLVITVISTVINACLAFFTAWMAYSTRQMARQTQRSVEVDQTFVERTKDSLMPVIEISLKINSPQDSSDRNDQFQLQLANVGVGPAFIREVTTREEVSRHTVYRSAIQSLIVPASTFKYVTLGRTLTINVQENFISSMSVWYTDVYGRWYRTRIVIQYPSFPENGQWIRVPTLISEFLPQIPKPTFSNGNDKDRYPDNYVGRYELGRLVPPGYPLSPQWHTLAARKYVQEGITIPSSDISQGVPLQISDVTWWLGEPSPEFIAQIKGYKPFVLGLLWRNDNGNPQPIILDVEMHRAFCATMPPRKIPNADQAHLDHWGLKNSNRVEADLVDLYQTILNSLSRNIL
ncbi:hypothetical protein [Sulfobacillus thermosulfidooxidans]|uniref:hypothetical protein n=1 Tax=Sulfobacillus thermosulfidooxidans TaxID=28034 RepID=UPI00096B6D6D|nr:hypothetical protein [Sulfobacillus thermosulfidooxidans]OLZ09883.1 hypothetical protein BFX05_13215 [Sulfobacillus thermosulfidooxidans]OLZ15811.1 hypothetical protein BFX06_01825 [Sulfobacillus thermosulfidooxidans]OLZ18342.1 hypothetical protein BFX07_08300 [Sulfobacillus thermosulfidooxidans]